jgi:hypothetical protein
MDKLAGPNDLVPSFKIFSMLIIITIVIKMIFQYSYNENAAPSFSDVNSLTDVSLIKDEIKKKDSSDLKKEVTVYFKSYIFYYLTLLWTVCLMITIVSITLNKYDVNKPGCIAKMSMLNVVPITLFMLLLGWIIYQNTVYYNKINSGHVAESYVTFDTAVNILLLVQAGIMYAYINQQMLCSSEMGQYSEAMSKYGPYIAAFVALLAGGCMTLNEIILRFFTTDG